MEWLVMDVVYLKTTGGCVLILCAGSLKMMAEVTCETAVQPGDILYPVADAMYLINKDDNQPLKVTSASSFSATQWHFLKKCMA